MISGRTPRLVGCHHVEGRYPTLAPGDETDGRLLRLDDGDIETLDAYEGVDRELYVRVRVPAGDEGCWTYLGDPDALGVDVSWPGDGPFGERVHRYVSRNDARIER